MRSIELIDEKVVGKLLRELPAVCGEFSMLVMPDHPTPISIRTHSGDPIPFMIYRSGRDCGNGADKYDEDSAAKTGLFVASGAELTERFLNY